jgi:two-component system, cell cycle sensor histidine kinase PleC
VTAALLAAGAALALAALAAALWQRERRRSREARQELGHQQARADAAASAGQAFFDAVTHELRSPIAAILGYQELLRDGAYGAMGDGAREPLERIGRSAHHLLLLVDGIVDLAQERAGSLQPHLENVRLHDLLHTAARTFQLQAQERALRHSVHLDPDIPDIRSDPERAARAVDLLLTTAVKHPAGERLELRMERAPDGATIRVRGTRIPAYAKAADPAVRAGVRMAIVESTVRLLGGELRVGDPHGEDAAEVVLHLRDAPSL